jgi:hypothetical protein
MINTTVIAAFIAAGASVIAAILSGIFGSRNQTKLIELPRKSAHENALFSAD